MAEPTPVPVPRDNVNDEVVILVRWHVEPGARVDAAQLIAEIETSKTVVEVHAPRPGVVHHWHPAGGEVAVGDTLCVIADDLAAAESAATTAPTVTVPRAAAVDRPVAQPQERHDSPRPGHASLRLSAKAAAVARDRGIDATSLAGRGLVRARDLAGGGAPPVPGPTAAAARIVADVPSTSEALPRRKLAEVRTLAGGAAGALPSWVSIACPTRGLRRLAATRAEMHGNATALVVFEVARLLRQFPVFNAVYDDGAIRRYQEVNVGFAVDAGHGLKVPVIRAADTKPLAVIALEMQQAIYDYLEDALPLESLARGTFCVSDLSGEDVTQFQPLISEGQSAILGIGAEWFPGDPAGPGSYSLVLAFDHRVAEGRVAGQFLRSLRDRLAAHEATLFSGRDAGPVPGAGAAPTPVCSRCGRGGPELVPLNGVMVATVHPPGHVCSLCLGGF